MQFADAPFTTLFRISSIACVILSDRTGCSESGWNPNGARWEVVNQEEDGGERAADGGTEKQVDARFVD